MSFIISLFVEMYGIPLTVFFLSSYFGGVPNTYWKGHLFGIPGFVVGSVILAIGVYLIISGWRKIFAAKGELADTGVYGLVRHPQYLGFTLLTLGWLIHWPTIITAIIWPILTISYYRLARKEEDYLRSKFGDKYDKYAKRVPMFVPRLGRN